ncbi:MAG TPA: flagellar motor protein MotB [Solirubrobacteraceae bacterium]|nr:flagellar motor protein MotB [Solirubrobacteraceae bacterium]
MARGRKRAGHGGGEESEERWLLTYADMITLLMALFMVLFSISSVNVSKYQVLQHSLKAAFSGNILPGGKSLASQGATNNSSHVPQSADMQAVTPVTALSAPSATETTKSSSSSQSSQSAAAAAAHQNAAAHESQVFAHIKQRLEAYAAKHGFSKSVKVAIEPKGLVIRVLTDDLLFPSGQASLDNRAHGLLGEIAELLNVDSTHPLDVEGNTDDVPIQSAQFPSNWELSTARASTVVRFLIEHGVTPRRLTATGNADQHPLASDATAAGRARNRRVEIVMRRIFTNEAQSEP